MEGDEIGRIPAEPYGAALIAPTTVRLLSSGCNGWLGRYGARCDRTATGPTPGPPPPCGMQNVLCRLRCDPSPPNSPGLASPSRALKLADGKGVEWARVGQYGEISVV